MKKIQIPAETKQMICQMRVC